MIKHFTALYSPLDIAYNQVMSGPYKDLSVKADDFEIIAGEKNGKVSGFWRPMVAIGDVRGIIEDWDIESYLDYLPLGNISSTTKYLLARGYKATAVYACVINLKCPQWSEVRKSYKSLINNFKVISDDFQIYKERHILNHDRTNATYEIQRKMAENEQAYVVNGESSSGLFYRNADWSYYASAVDGGEGLHGVIWNGILRAEKFGCLYMDLGDLIFSGDLKLKEISFFKTGFGGHIKTRLLLKRKDFNE